MQPQQDTGRVVEDDRVTVVVASRDRREALLGSVARHRSLARHRAPVLLLDDASSDGTSGAVRRAHPDVAEGCAAAASSRVTSWTSSTCCAATGTCRPGA